MQRLPDHMRDVLATRNPPDNWIKRKMTVEDYLDKYGTQGTSVAVLTALQLLDSKVASREAKDHAIAVVEEIMRDLTDTLRYAFKL